MFPRIAFPSIAFPPIAFPPSLSPPTPVLIEKEVSAFLNARLPYQTWGDTVAKGAPRPLFRLSRVGGAPIARRLRKGRARLNQVRLQFDALADDRDGAELAIEALADTLDGFAGKMGRATIKAALRQAERGGYDPTGAGTAAGTVRRMDEYIISYY